MSLIFDEKNKAITNCVAGSTPQSQLQPPAPPLQSTNDTSCAEIGDSDTITTNITTLGMISSSPTASTTSSSSTCESGVVLKSNNNSINSSLSTSPVSSKSSLSIRTSVNTISTSAHLNNNTTYINGNQQQQQTEENNYSALCNSSKMDTNAIIDHQSNKNCPDILLANYSNVSNTISYNNDFGGFTTNSNTGHHHHQQLHLNDINSSSECSQQQMLNDGNSLTEDPRTLQLALNLSMLGINDNNVVTNHQTTTMMPHVKLTQAQAHSTSHMAANPISLQQALSQSFPNPTNPSLLLPPIEERSKKSQNMTECVPVPSSEHVAEIVGRQGCKIKALRAKTNTYIKTPVRGEEPVFVVTGRKEDVGKAKREILSAADHFSLIRATRKPSLEGSISGGGGGGNGSGGGGSAGCNNDGNNGRNPPCPQSIPGQITIQVRVPYRVVGLVVGPKGATIKHIQQETHTYIVTPSREKEPIFEVTGLPENVQSARRQIEAHIAVRTGSLQNSNHNLAANGMTTDDTNSAAVAAAGGHHTINSISQLLNEDINQDFLTTICKNGISSAFEFIEGNNKINTNNTADSIGPIDFSSNSVDLSMQETMKLSNFTGGGGTIGMDGGIVDHHNIMHNIVAAAQNNFNTNNNNYRRDNTKSNDYLKTQFLCNGTANVGGIDCNNAGGIANFLTAPTTNTSKSNEMIIGSVVGVGGSSMPPQQAGVVEMMLNNTSSALMTGSCSSASSTSSRSANKSGDSRLSVSAKSNSSRPELLNIWQNLGDSCEIDEGIGESPSIWNLSKNMIALTGAHCSPTTSISPTDSLLGDHALNLRNSKECTSFDGGYGGGGESKPQQQLIMMQHLNGGGAGGVVGGVRRECLICNAKEVTAALVPCGHNMFCMDCANRICTSGNANCPICNVTVYHAMRILA